MTLIKVLKIECTECHEYLEISDCEYEFDMWIEQEICPRCLKETAEAI